MAHYFISDLHLDKSRPATSHAFIDFLQNIQTQATALYILGDFIEYWVGDDDNRHGLDTVFDALKHFSNICPVYFMHGNRDFLIGESFCKQYNIHLLDDPSIINIEQYKIILSHGDILCTDDEDYVQFRQQVRSEEWQKNFLSQNLKKRVEIAEQLRTQSKAAMQSKPVALMDVNQQAVEHCIAENNTNILIHGHTHKANIHNHLIAQQHCLRIVLSDWHDKASYLKISGNEAELVTDNFIKTTTLIA